MFAVDSSGQTCTEFVTCLLSTVRVPNIIDQRCRRSSMRQLYKSSNVESNLFTATAAPCLSLLLLSPPAMASPSMQKALFTSSSKQLQCILPLQQQARVLARPVQPSRSQKLQRCTCSAVQVGSICTFIAYQAVPPAFVRRTTRALPEQCR